MIDLPVRIAFAPRMVLFASGDREPKSSAVTFGDDTPVTIVKVVVESPELRSPSRPSRGRDVRAILRYVGPAEKDSRTTCSSSPRAPPAPSTPTSLYLRHRP
ncbi:MAG: hypothetical protein QM765_11475 [Myxococcales bacterium]